VTLRTSLFPALIFLLPKSCSHARHLVSLHPSWSVFKRTDSADNSLTEMVDARGSGEPQGVSLMFQVALERILANKTGAVSQSVVYSAGFDQNVTAGVQNVADIIQYGLQDCPDQKYFLFGYSQGATVVLEALNILDSTSIAAVSSVVLVGNPYRIPGRLSNVDSLGRVDNRTSYGVFATQALQSNSSIPTYNEDLDRSGKVSDICLEVSTQIKT
jgi:pimeloyl-ACP methyl ester carboxylesterase